MTAETEAKQPPSSVPYRLMLGAVSALALGYVCTHEILLTPDYASYRAHSIIRPPVLPLLLDAFSFLFQGIHLRAFTVFQTLFVFLGAAAFVETLRRRFAVGTLFCVLSYCALLSPIATQDIGNTILTEASSYGLFLLAMSVAAELITEATIRKVALLAALIALGTLLRSQLSLLWAGYVFLLAYLSLRERQIKLLLKGTLFLGMALIFSFLARSSYNYLCHGVFGQLGAGMHLSADILFVSEPQDLKFFKDKPYYNAIQEIYKGMADQRLFAKDRFALELPMAVFSLQRAAPIGQATSLPLYRYVGGSLPGDPGVPARDGKMLTAMNGIQLDIYRTLSPLRYKDYLRLILSRFSRNISPFEIVACLMASAWLAISSWRRQKSFPPLPEMAAFALILNVINVASISAVTYVIFRYTFYTQMLELALATALLGAIVGGKNRLAGFDASPG